MKTVIHYPIDVDSEVGDKLVKQYKVGKTYPVFVLADNNADVIYRWTGYTGSSRFMYSFNQAKKEMITVSDRTARFQKNPTMGDALFLAQYNADTREYLQAIDYYRKAEKITGGARDYSYDIFKNMANAIWTDMAEYDRIFPAADSVLAAGGRNASNIIGMAQIMSRLARKKDKTDTIAKYIQAGIDAAKKSRNSSDAENLALLEADYALYARYDTSGAVNLRKNSLGTDWKRKPDKFYDFAKWCGERKINLEEAEFYAREAAKRAMGNEFKARVLSTLAEICYAKGNSSEAVSLIEKAIDLDPVQEGYMDQLLEYSN